MKIIVALPDEWKQQLKKITPSRSDGGLNALIRRLLVEHAKTQGITLIDDTKAVGVRDDYAQRKTTLETGWLSRLYRDRYQLVAVWDTEAGQFIYHHLHLVDKLPSGTPLMLRCETPIVAEVAIYAPDSADETMVRQQAAMDLYEQVDSLLEEFAS